MIDTWYTEVYNIKMTHYVIEQKKIPFVEPVSERVLSHACKELKMTRQQIADRFHIQPEFISDDHIKRLWLEYLRKK